MIGVWSPQYITHTARILSWVLASSHPVHFIHVTLKVKLQKLEFEEDGSSIQTSTNTPSVRSEYWRRQDAIDFRSRSSLCNTRKWCVLLETSQHGSYEWCWRRVEWTLGLNSFMLLTYGSGTLNVSQEKRLEAKSGRNVYSDSKNPSARNWLLNLLRMKTRM